MRGLACLFMFQTHCYDAWLSPAARQGRLIYWSQMGGTLPAPTFLFLAGFSFVLVTLRLRDKGFDANQIARQTILRGAEILGFGLLFRLQEYVVAWGWAPWTDLLRVDVLNIIGLSSGSPLSQILRANVKRSQAECIAKNLHAVDC